MTEIQQLNGVLQLNFEGKDGLILLAQGGPFATPEEEHIWSSEVFANNEPNRPEGYHRMLCGQSSGSLFVPADQFDAKLGVRRDHPTQEETVADFLDGFQYKIGDRVCVLHLTLNPDDLYERYAGQYVVTGPICEKTGDVGVEAFYADGSTETKSLNVIHFLQESCLWDDREDYIASIKAEGDRDINEYGLHPANGEPPTQDELEAFEKAKAVCSKFGPPVLSFTYPEENRLPAE